MGSFCALEEKHGVDLASGYTNDKACATFVHFIAKDQALDLVHELTKAIFSAFRLTAPMTMAMWRTNSFLSCSLTETARTGKYMYVVSFSQSENQSLLILRVCSAVLSLRWDMLE